LLQSVLVSGASSFEFPGVFRYPARQQKRNIVRHLLAGALDDSVPSSPKDLLEDWASQSGPLFFPFFEVTLYSWNS
jgi:hypothetical protein